MEETKSPDITNESPDITNENHDITEENPVVTNDFLMSLFDSLPVPMVIARKDGKLEFWNTEFENLIERDSEEQAISNLLEFKYSRKTSGDLDKFIAVCFHHGKHAFKSTLTTLKGSDIKVMLNGSVLEFNDQEFLIIIISARNMTTRIPYSITGFKSYHAFEREYLLKVLKHTNYRVRGEAGAAKILKLPPTTVESKLRRFNIKKPFSK